MLLALWSDPTTEKTWQTNACPHRPAGHTAVGEGRKRASPLPPREGCPSEQGTLLLRQHLLSVVGTKEPSWPLGHSPGTVGQGPVPDATAAALTGPASTYRQLPSHSSGCTGRRGPPPFSCLEPQASHRHHWPCLPGEGHLGRRPFSSVDASFSNQVDFPNRIRLAHPELTQRGSCGRTPRT